MCCRFKPLIQWPEQEIMMQKLIDVMCCRFKPLIQWPEQEIMMQTMPIVFKNAFKRCTVIIDCFEILRARAQTWSNYKHHNTVSS